MRALARIVRGDKDKDKDKEKEKAKEKEKGDRFKMTQSASAVELNTPGRSGGGMLFVGDEDDETDEFDTKSDIVHAVVHPVLQMRCPRACWLGVMWLLFNPLCIRVVIGEVNCREMCFEVLRVESNC